MDTDRGRDSRGPMTNLGRLTRYRLIIPLKRGQMPPEHVARGVAVGLAVAFTPTVGIQLIAVLGIWALARAVTTRFHFHLVAAMAWVWVTNIFTIGPIYYTFLLTGQLMLGRFDELGSIGFDTFTLQLADVVNNDSSFLEGLWIGTLTLFKVWGLPLFIGSIPWAIGTAWVGYVWSRRFIIRFRAARHNRWAKKQERKAQREQKDSGGPAA